MQISEHTWMTTSSDESTDIGGNVDVAERAIVNLVRDTVCECYGVVGIGAGPGPKLSARLPALLRREPITISVVDGKISVAVPIIVKFGTPITTVARNVIQTVSFQLRQTLGLDVERVDIRVSALRHGSNAGA